MRFPVQILVIIVLGYLFEQFLPWWSVAVAAFIGGLLVTTRFNYLAGFIGLGFLWVSKALITDVSSQSGFADRVARILMLHDKAILLFVTFVLIGLVGGFAAMAGGGVRNLKFKI